MSGFEIVGVILGALPLVISALEHYAKGVSTAKRFWQYKSELKSLLRQIKTENAIFINTCEALLTGIVRVDQMTLFLKNPGGQVWRDPKIEKKLEERLKGAYEGYADTVVDMKAVLERFMEKLMLDPAGKVQFSDPNTFKQEFKRLKFSISRSAYEDLLNKIRQNNVTLSQLTKQSLTLETTRATYRHSSPNFRAVQDCARSVYTILRSGWQCRCQAPHTVNLRLEPRDNEDISEDEDEKVLKQLRFRVVFSFGHGSSSSKPSPWRWEEADIRLVEEKPKCTIPASSPSANLAACPLNPPNKKNKKGVRFATQAQNTLSATLEPEPNLTPIQDLCKAIAMLQQPQRDLCLGFLVDEFSKRKHGIYPLPPSSMTQESWTVLSLSHVLSRKADLRRPFTRYDKLRVAVILASSVLQLHKTPWIDEKWGKDDILFINRPNGTLFDHPYVSRQFFACRNPQTNQPCSSDGLNTCRVIRNKALFDLGVLLIEIWYGQSLENLRIPADLNTDGTPNITSNWCTADRLVDEIHWDAGSRYSEAVRRCIRCDFDRRETNLEDENFQQAVYDGVVSLLEKNFRQFNCLD